MNGSPAEVPDAHKGSGISLFGGLLCCVLIVAPPCAEDSLALQLGSPAAGVSRSSAAACEAKVKRLQSLGTTPDSAKGQTTRLSEMELNSYLALVLSPQYHPCLKSIRLKFEAERLQAVASIDFDRLELGSTQLLGSIFRKILVGRHTLMVAGNLVSGEGKAHFKLQDARFDSLNLPNLLVSEIISAVGRRQNPPFDPMQPSSLPYGIQRVEVRSGSIVIYH